MKVVILVPPFATIERPSLAAHILQACAIDAGFETSVLYTNLRFAKIISEKMYYRIYRTPLQDSWGERLFCRLAFNRTPLGALDDNVLSRLQQDKDSGIGIRDLEMCEAKTDAFTDEILTELKMGAWDFIGATTTFEQTAASIALLRYAKTNLPKAITAIGGANCQGEMAIGIAELCNEIDYVFSGEGENEFPSLLKRLASGEDGGPRIINTSVPVDLNKTPALDYSDYYRQLKLELPGSKTEKNGIILLPYETSRGCWWGQKKQCTFCGLNGTNIQYRERNPLHALSEIKSLLINHPTRKIILTDNVMPKGYLKSFVPEIITQLGKVEIAYEVRSTMPFESLNALKTAGITKLQPGIEALSDGLLKRMRKGVLPRHNVVFLRSSRILSIDVGWNLLIGFPNDIEQEYIETIKLIKLIKHLQPPSGITPISLDRFCVYQSFPEKFGIKNLKPWKVYSDIYPRNFDVSKIAIRFEGEYNSFILNNKEVMQELYTIVQEWQNSWKKPMDDRPILLMQQIAKQKWLLLDSRETTKNSNSAQIISTEQAELLLCDWPIDQKKEDPITSWAEENGFIVQLNGFYITLVTGQKNLSSNSIY